MKKIYIITLICIVVLYTYQIVQAPVDEYIPDQKVKKTITLNFVGDILAARTIETTMRKKGYDYPFSKIATELSVADITFANLETPLIGTATSGKTTVGGNTVFRGDVLVADALKRAGIDIVSIANNHMKDQGTRGVLETVRSLDAAGVKNVGAGANLTEARRLKVIDIDVGVGSVPIRVGYLAYNDSDVVPESYHATQDQAGTNIMDIPRLQEDVTQARSQVDILVVSMHSGNEYTTTKVNTRQSSFAHAAIDSGADFVIGHHPHVLQPLEIYRGKYIFYSLGNFVFDQPWPDTRESALLNMKITLSESDNTEAGGRAWDISQYNPQILPLMIRDFQPQKVIENVGIKQVLERFYKDKSLFSVGGQNLFVNLATTSLARSQGLSGVEKLPKETGLLFVFDTPDRHGIWMKDMFFPIDIYWFDKDLKLIDKRLSMATSTYPNVFYPKGDALYVLEVQEGLLRDMSLTQDLTGELTLLHSYDKR